MSCYIVAEIGINANGSMTLTKTMIDIAKDAGCDAVKFQKRDIDIVYTAEELAKPRKNPFGATNGDLKRGLEFSPTEYGEIARYCLAKEIDWGVSVWDCRSATQMAEIRPKTAFLKIASPGLTDRALRQTVRALSRKHCIPVILSTGMSTPLEIDIAVKHLEGTELTLLHCTSAYPPPSRAEINLSHIRNMQKRYGLPWGYSGHEDGIGPTVAAAAMGATIIERHFTLDKAMWGSDQKVSIPPELMRELVRRIRGIEASQGDGIKRVYESELPHKKKLRRIQ